MATRLSATAAAIGLVGGVLATSSAVAAVPSAPAAPAVPASGSIPFSVADPDTAPRPVVTVAIGGVPLLLLLDTGSTGIRVAADKIPGKAVAVTGPAAAYGYGSGIQLHGDQADADVAIGENHTGPLPIELVRSTDCFTDKPDCPAAHGVKPAMFGGVLDGIMGVSPEEISGLVNPLWALHDAAGRHLGRQFAVRYDPAQVSGEVMLNVPAAGYGLVQLPRTPDAGSHHRGATSGYDARAYVSSYTGSYASRAGALRDGAPATNRPEAAALAMPPSWNPRAVQTCVEGTGLRKTCGPAMFDTGTPEFALNVPGGPAGVWPSGRSLVVGVPAAGWSAAYSTGAGNGVTVADEPSTAASGTLIGLPAFAKGPIRFDLEAGTVGFPVAAASNVASAATVPQQRGLVEAALAPAAVQPTPTPPPSTPSPTPSPTPKPKHVTPKKNYPRLPFHTGKKARSLPDTGVPMSAALGAVTALTALLAGIGTVLAARRRPDHES
ncbi:hypothetical protein [Catenulispora acidiphila]|uniref:hypothetical protein n=1 Tax=Catenulispora acidiphila TaxID=304895 RepID=UPI00167FDFE2|nr:hypothetical protein [Catenulispora acidiphila]